MYSIHLSTDVAARAPELAVLAERWKLQHDEEAQFALVLTAERLELRKRDEPKLGAICVDFVGGTMAHRRRFGGGRGEAVAKAVGVKRLSAGCGGCNCRPWPRCLCAGQYRLSGAFVRASSGGRRLAG
ncbi:class I SAM-dependent methyltransferase [Plesiomonas shigelloides subsp. oncorhynchi]|nr:class I SAM-dependent methyltransferase [Plesiomonas shigelloides]